MIDDVVIRKHNTIHTNGNINVIQIHKLVNFNVNNSYSQKDIDTAHNITNYITRPNNNNYDHNAIEQLNQRITHINKYDTGIHYNCKKALNTNN